ncbi:chorismate synthase [bacterium]|nr:chorismate synthase [bacterium]
MFRWTTFGESHGPAMGVVIDGCPSGVPLQVEDIQRELNRRRPGQVDSKTSEVLVSSRNEEDRVEILSGVYEGKTLGTPIACMVKNTNQKSEDYKNIAQNPRTGHADDVWKNKFGHSDPRGGGRSSGRETLCRVIAGSVAQQFLKHKFPELKVLGFVKSIGDMELNEQELQTLNNNWLTQKQTVDEFSARFPTSRFDIVNVLLKAKEMGESYGGVVELWVDGVPAHLGEPIFYKLKNVLASAMMSIGATCGFEMGDGFAMTRQKGTEVHVPDSTKPYGGIRGGISTGERIVFRTGFKPTSSILDVAKKGRHDPCIVPRAVPAVEAMTWAVLADLVLLGRPHLWD